MTKVLAVIGAGYGDEGKGVITDYLAHHHENSIVVRYNGGAQAGHTVTTPDGKRHVFSHFGSGSFSGRPTLLSEFFVCNPLIFKRERMELLLKLDFMNEPRIFIHKDCLVTTPVDMVINQIMELRRVNNRHGSVGVGFNETIERSLVPEFKLTVDDLRQGEEHRNAIIDNIQANWINQRLTKIDNPCDEECKLLRTILSEQLWFDFKLAIEYFLSYTMMLYDYHFDYCDTIIFEGAQGLMLDQDYGDFPHVTRSNTGVKNIIKILEHVDNIEEIDIHYITRAYVTRHGHGPMFGEQELPYDIVDETNKPHAFQGTIRHAPLHFNRFYDAIFQDFDQLMEPKHNLSKKAICNIVVTCLDQIKDIGLYYDFMSKSNIDANPFNLMVQLSGGDFIDIILDHANMVSYGPTREHVKINSPLLNMD